MDVGGVEAHLLGSGWGGREVVWRDLGLFTRNVVVIDG